MCKLHKNVSINMYDILLYREVCGIYAYKKSWIGRVKVVCWGFSWGTVDVNLITVWVMMMKMVGCLGYVGKVSEREKVLWFSYRDSWRKWMFACASLHSLFESYFKPFYSCFPHTLMEKKRDRWSTSTIILTVYFSVVVAHTLILLWIKQQLIYII